MRRVVFDATEPIPVLRKTMEYRASAYHREMVEASILYEVKGVRAIWNPDLGDGHGGYTCPPGTRYGGRWTDKFGRNCGGGITRRIGNALGKINGVDEDVVPVKTPKAVRKARRNEERARKLESRARKLEDGNSIQSIPPRLQISENAPKARAAKRAVKNENRARRLSNLARELDGADEKPATPEREMVGEVRAENPIKVPGKNRRIVVRQERERQRPVRRRRRPQARRVPPPPRPLPEWSPPKPRVVPAPPRVSGNIPGGPDTARRIEKRNIWAAFNLDANNPDQLKLLTDKEVDVLVGQVRDKHNHARLPVRKAVLRELYNGLSGEKNDRALAWRREVEANPEKFPIYGQNRVILVSNLTPTHFTEVEREILNVNIGAIQDELPAKRPNWDNTFDLQDRQRELNLQTALAEQKKTTLEAELRQFRKDGLEKPEVVRAKQLMLVQHKQTKNVLSHESQIVGQRLEILDQRQRIQNALRTAKDAKENLDARENALTLAAVAHNTLTRMRLFDPVNGRDGDEFNAHVEEDINLTRDYLKDLAIKVDGVRDLDAIIDRGGKTLQDKQNRLDALIGSVVNAPEDKKEDAAERLKAHRDQLKAERLALGPEVRTLAEIDANNTRRWHDLAIREAGKALRSTGGSDRRLSVYMDVTTESPRPSVMGIDDVAGSAVEIKNPTIDNIDTAVAYIKNGGSMDDVPNEFWLEAIRGNASEVKTDATTLFRIMEKDQGAVGETWVFQARNPDGTGSPYGYVVKAGREHLENVGEIISQQLMIDHGFPTIGGTWDGVGVGRRRGDHAVVLPYATGGVGEVSRVGGKYNFDATKFDGMEAESIAPRLHGFLHNYLMGVTDRHSGNSFTMIANGHPVVIPIDQGWAGKLSEYTGILEYYSDDYGMDNGEWGTGHLFEDANIHLGDPAQLRHAQAVVEVYDQMIERGHAIVEEGVERWIERSVLDGHGSRKISEDRLRLIFAGYEARLEIMERDRKRTLSKLMPLDVYGKVA